MRITNRSVNLALMGGVSLMALLIFVFLMAGNPDILGPGNLPTLLVSLLLTGLFVAYWRGWDEARYVVVALITLAAAATMPEPYVSQQLSLAVLVPPALAMVLTGPWWVLGSTVTVVLGLLLRAGGQGIYAQPINLILIAMVVGGIVLSQLLMRAAQRDAEVQARRAEEALAKAEANAAELARQAVELTEQNEEQRRLIDLVATLETPAVALADGVILAPVVGHLDSRRAAGLTERLLRDVAGSRARLVVLDIAAVAAVDTGVAQALLRAVQAVRLLGCDVTITGISASIAATMTELGISMAGVRTARTPQEALGQALTAAPRPAPGAVHKN